MDDYEQTFTGTRDVGKCLGCLKSLGEANLTVFYDLPRRASTPPESACFGKICASATDLSVDMTEWEEWALECLSGMVHD